LQCPYWKYEYSGKFLLILAVFETTGQSFHEKVLQIVDLKPIKKPRGILEVGDCRIIATSGSETYAH
jgi:hypothetical protein